MTGLPQEILKTFDALPDSEQLEVGLAILKRLIHYDFPPLDDEDLALNAEELFLELDQQESDHEWSCSRRRLACGSGLCCQR